MKYTTKDKNGNYVTYEDATDILVGGIFEKYGSLGCLLAVWHL
jgi:hypothetical protein